MPLLIKSIDLPKRLPHPDAIRSWGQSQHNYNPEFWEFSREYALLEKDVARQDDERLKHAYILGDYAKVTLEDGTELRVIGDIKQTVSGVDYFVYCVSCDWDYQLFHDFDVDCCVVIKSPDAFASRLSAAANSQLNGWYFHHCPIQYFDPYEMGRNQRIDNAMSKDFKFAYQREYRFLWASFQGLNATGFKDLELGPLHDIADLCPIPT